MLTYKWHLNTTRNQHQFGKDILAFDLTLSPVKIYAIAVKTTYQSSNGKAPAFFSNAVKELEEYIELGKLDNDLVFMSANGQRIKTGKKDKFPVADEKSRAKMPSDEKYEKPLLLDPCKDDPAKHLEFTEEGLVRPKRGGKYALRAEQSISVYGLQRRQLVDPRKDHATLVLAQIKRVKELTEDLNNNINSTITTDCLER